MPQGFPKRGAWNVDGLLFLWALRQHFPLFEKNSQSLTLLVIPSVIIVL